MFDACCVIADPATLTCGDMLWMLLLLLFIPPPLAIIIVIIIVIIVIVLLRTIFISFLLCPERFFSLSTSTHDTTGISTGSGSSSNSSLLSRQFHDNGRHVVFGTQSQTCIQEFFANQSHIRFAFLKHGSDFHDTFLIRSYIPNPIACNNHKFINVMVPGMNQNVGYRTDFLITGLKFMTVLVVHFISVVTTGSSSSSSRKQLGIVQDDRHGFESKITQTSGNGQIPFDASPRDVSTGGTNASFFGFVVRFVIVTKGNGLTGRHGLVSAVGSSRKDGPGISGIGTHQRIGSNDNDARRGSRIAVVFQGRNMISGGP
mmetsp:Transcript_2591/g.4911  ORF Transcript_2591/g.4911 Transcript_2591/m.4911 type:complete len:316 (+) Transcript_2591:598-1545(+)